MVLVTTSEHEFYEKFPLLSKHNTFPDPILFDIVWHLRKETEEHSSTTGKLVC